MITEYHCRRCQQKTVLTHYKQKICGFCAKKDPIIKKLTHVRCPICDSLFATNNKKRIYCSSECYQLKTPCILPKFHNILARDKFKCQLCGEQIFPYGTSKRICVHHIKPKEHGGSDEDENLTTLCSSCHVKVHRFQSKYPKLINLTP